jgi:ectoine hydroxylase-related dioxygenase (phytanoyl-CoA dioxygenase family)
MSAVPSISTNGSNKPAAPSVQRDDAEAVRQFYAENGYAILRNVVSKDKLTALHRTIVEEFDRSKASGALFSGGGTLTGHLNCLPGEASRFAYDECVEKGVIDLLASLIAKPLGQLNVGLNFNLPNSVAQHYHVDSQFKDEFVIANVAVVDTDLVNGAIDVVPGTHKKFYKYWRFAIERPYEHAARLQMKQGDVLLRTSNLWHRGMPNKSAVARPMFAMTFGEKRRDEAQDPFKLNDGKVLFYPNWYRTNFLGRMRERTYVAAPITYSAYRFVRSLFGTKGYGTP